LVAVDGTAIINRIIDILKADTTLSSKIRNFHFGEDNWQQHDNPPPYILVTMPDQMFTSNDTFGIGDGESDVQTTAQFQISGFVLGNDSEFAEKEKYEIVKQVQTILRANPRLRDPVSSNDPLCIRSVILSVNTNDNTRGKETQGFTLLLQCQIGSQVVISLGSAGTGLANVSVISISADKETEVVEDLFDTRRFRQGVAPIVETRFIIFEIEYVESQVDLLRASKRSRTPDTIRMTRGTSGSILHTGRILDISSRLAFDQIETVTFQFEIFPTS